MKHLVAIVSCPTGIAHTLMAAEALKQTAVSLGIDLRVETHGSVGARSPLTDAEIARADAVLIAADIHVEMRRFAGKPVHEVRTRDAIRDTRVVLEAALALTPGGFTAPSPDTAAPSAAAAKTAEAPVPSPAAAAAPGKRLVGITACPTGIAHTFMAASALEKAAAALGHTIRIETRGSVGAKNELTPEEIAGADAVVIAADTGVDLARFAGKPLYATSTKAALHDGRAVIQAALDQPAPAPGAGAAGSLVQSVESAKAA